MVKYNFLAGYGYGLGIVTVSSDPVGVVVKTSRGSGGDGPRCARW
jgi:hypothetical protein